MTRLRPQKVDWAQIGRFLESAERKLAAAEKIFAIDEEACLQQAYEAMLRASLGFMLSHGVRVRSKAGHHIAIIEFVEKHLGRGSRASSSSRLRARGFVSWCLGGDLYLL